ncbi:MAG: aryl-sulfate sulfotransferase [Deltaproteobacteria bacterium]|nr:aryl-sulfate sulfotransferase [Deltaproteobacteria bacterium]
MKKWILFFGTFLFTHLSFSSAYAYEALSGPSQLIQYKASKAYEGYTLFSPMFSDKTYIIDMLGNVVHVWEHKGDSPGLHYILLENGNILGNTRERMGPKPKPGEPMPKSKQNPNPNKGLNFGGGVKGLREIDWDGNVVWEWIPGPEQGSLHHDFVRLQNGNTMTNAWEHISKEEAITGGRNSKQTTDRGIATDVIYEIDPKGNVVWKWDAWEHRGMNSKNHLDINYITNVLPQYRFGNPDWIHLNAIDYNPETDQILVDSREFGELYIIDHKTGEIVYRWGNPSTYGAGDPPTFTTTGDQILFGPHNAQWIKEGLPGAGNILIYNNGWARPPVNYSSVIEMDPKTGEIVWEYKSKSENSFYSHHISGAQRLPNGNTFICSGNHGHLFEVTKEGEVVWEYINPVTSGGIKSWFDDVGFQANNMVFQAHRYGPDYPGLKGKDLTPKGQIAEGIRDSWKPRVDLKGATQKGAKKWEKLWK